MKRRQTTALFAAAMALTLSGLSVPAAAQEAPKSIRIGYSLAKTGPNAPGGETTVRPNYDMWVKEVNAAGGLMLKAYGKRVPIEVVEYDDRSSTEEAVRAIERLISQDKVDLILPPWGTAVNLAVAPLLARHGYPQLGSTSLTDKSAEFAKRWPTIFFMLGSGGEYAESLMTMLDAARKSGKIGDKVAMLHVADGFGVDAAVAARKAADRYGFKLVVDKSYPVGSQDLSPLLNEVKAQAPDVFIAWSYPPDTVLISDQARVLSFNPKVFFTGVGTQFPFFKAKYGAGLEGQMSTGGVDGESALINDYFKRHKDLTGKEPDSWGSPVTYASLQVLQQAIERVGKIDRPAILTELKAGSFDTVLGPVKFKDQVLHGIFHVGQWQNGVFQGVAPSNLKGARAAVIPKPNWKN
jgi:branched-chain amino acid transport system substrate-binding protein